MAVPEPFFWLTAFFAVASFTGWAVLETRIPMMTLLSATSWALFAVASGGVTVITDCCVRTVSYPPLQWFGAFMALMSLLGLVLWRFGDFPPTETNQVTTR